MKEWIDSESKKPKSDWHIVLVTDGELVCLARWIEDPKKYYGEDLIDWDEKKEEYVQLDEEWHESHWLFETNIGPFFGNDECFGVMSDISHWMNLPVPPKQKQ
jgi:hypothetical protein